MLNSKRLLLILITGLLAGIALSCSDRGLDDPDEMVADILSQSSSFTEPELAVLNRSLNLKATPFNYANQPLPAHYRTGDTSESDNTPADNPITDMGATLGRVLFYDTKLSANNAISCASCHKQSAAFADNERLSMGLNGELTRRNTMGLINARYYEPGAFMWDESAATLEQQVLMPIENHTEMGLKLADMEAKLRDVEYYQILFTRTFGSPDVTSDRVAKALSQFVRSIVAIDSKFDRGLIETGTMGEEDTPPLPNFTAQENLGMDIFINRATCIYCHGTAQNVNDEAKNNGLSLNYQDKGKGEITGKQQDMAEFKVPSLRNIAQTAPYMHDGRFETLMDVVNHYSDNVQRHENLNFRLTTDEKRGGEVLRLNLSQVEKEALVAFLHTLTDESVLKAEKYSDPFKR